MAATFQPRLECWSYLRASLAVACLIGLSYQWNGEIAYARGMAATSAQESLDNLTLSAIAYPWDYRFRTAQAMQLFALARRAPELIPAAVQSLDNAFYADPGSLEIASKYYIAQCANGDKGSVKTAHQMTALSKSDAVMKLLQQLPQCAGNTK